jgi:hypothetical protein
MRLLRKRTPDTRLSSLVYMAFICLMLLLPFDRAAAQVCVEGVDYNTYTPDTLRIKSFRGLPGDTVYMPIHFKADSVVLALTANIRYDANVLRPIVFPDTLIDTTINNDVLPPDTAIDTTYIDFLDIIEVGRARLLDTLQDQFGFDSIVVRNLFRGASVKVRDSSLIKIQWLSKIPSQSEELDSIPGGTGEIVRVAFEVLDAGLPINTSRSLAVQHLPVLDTSVFPPVPFACALTASAQNWVVGFINPTPPPDTIFERLSLLQVPTLTGGFYIVDTAAVDDCVGAGDCPPLAGHTVQCISGQYRPVVHPMETVPRLQVLL